MIELTNVTATIRSVNLRAGVMIGREVTMSIEPPAAESERLAA